MGSEQERGVVKGLRDGIRKRRDVISLAAKEVREFDTPMTRREALIWMSGTISAVFRPDKQGDR